MYGNGVGKKCCHSLIYWVIGIYWVRDECDLITETYITEPWTDKLELIITFSIQVLKFSIASLEIANILWFSIRGEAVPLGHFDFMDFFR